MAFVNEEISDEDKEKYGIKNHFASHWTIDKEKGIFLIYVDAHGMGDSFDYELHIDNDFVLIESPQIGNTLYHEDGRVTIPAILDVIHDIKEITLNADSNLNYEAIKPLIKEALIAYGWKQNTERTNSVTVSFPDRVTYIKDLKSLKGGKK